MSGEFDLIKDHFSDLANHADGALNLLDDAALFDISPKQQIVATTDSLISGVHFHLDDPPCMVARKALRVNLSDLAAMGAIPVGFLQAIILNGSVNDLYLESYKNGLNIDIEHFHVPLYGGDTTVSSGPFSVTITALGKVEKGSALLRSGAQSGDVLCVTGTIGDSALGLACRNGKLSLSENYEEHLIDRYLLPEPRLKVGQQLAGLVGACIDISDGLVADVGHICRASGFSASIDRDSIPLSESASAAVSKDRVWWECILGGGDDYEIAFTTKLSRLESIISIGQEAGVPIKAIGRIGETRDDKMEVVVLDSKSAEIHVSTPGYRHR